MSEAQGFDLHPLAAQDITDIWEFIAQDSLLAARRVREDILDAIRALVPFPVWSRNPYSLKTRGISSRPEQRFNLDVKVNLLAS